MHLLLCAATEFEIRPTLDALAHNGAENPDVLITGVGLMAATYRLTRQVLIHRPSLIIQAGIAGSFDDDLPPGTLVEVASDFVGDEGGTEEGRFRSLFDLGFAAADVPPFTAARLHNPNQPSLRSAVRRVAGVTVNEITTDPGRIQHYRERGAQVESMEGAALHYVALQQNIDFIQLRAISNVVGERDKSKWTIGTAIAALNTELLNFIQQRLTS